ncbi:hypothetical protein [Candidatus Magnetominusculus dajiuhuensis]|uniref:hypothetical protein n=1 Tax=Candidatus Magnetominusculus dajiuhuensis TaxID=3137712 RepID=UPI003B4351FA
MELNIDKYCLRYGLDNSYHALCPNCVTDNVISPGAEGHKCGHCGALLTISRYPISIIAIRGHQVTSAVIRDSGGLRVVCGSCGLIIYVRCEGEEFINCNDCGIQIDYSSYPE